MHSSHSNVSVLAGDDMQTAAVSFSSDIIQPVHANKALKSFCFKVGANVFKSQFSQLGYISNSKRTTDFNINVTCAKSKKQIACTVYRAHIH